MLPVHPSGSEFIHWLTAEHAEDAETYLVFSAISALSAVNYQGSLGT